MIDIFLTARFEAGVSTTNSRLGVRARLNERRFRGRDPSIYTRRTCTVLLRDTASQERRRVKRREGETYFTRQKFEPRDCLRRR